MPDITQFQIEMNTTEITVATQALELYADASERAGQTVTTVSARVTESRQMLRSQTETAREAGAVTKALGEDSSKAADSLYDTVKAVKEFAGASAQLGAALLTGDVGKMSGGLHEFADKSGLAELAVQKLGKGGALGLGLVAEGVLLVAEAYVTGWQESDKFAKSLQITGNFAGITEGQFNAMAHAISDLDNAGVGSARAALQTLVSTGQFAGGALESVGAAAVTMAQLTGQPADAVAADFAKMADGVVKWVDTHDSQYNILTTAQYQHIRALEEEGKTQEAMELTGKLINDGMKQRVDNLGYIESALQTGKKAWGDFWDAALDWGRKDTPEKKIARLQNQMASVLNSGIDFAGAHPDTRMTPSETADYVKRQQAKIDAAKKEKEGLEKAASDRGAAARARAEGKEGVRVLEGFHTRFETQQQKTEKEIKKYRAANADVLADKGVVDSPAEQARIEARIRQSHAKAAPAGSDASQAVLNGQMKSIQDSLALAKEHNAQLAKLDELRYKGKELSDEQFFQAKQARIQNDARADIAAYNQTIALLEAYHGKTAEARQANVNKIAETAAARTRVEQKSAADLALLDEAEKQRKAAIAAEDDKQAEARIAGLVAEADKMETVKTAHEKPRSQIERDAIGENRAAIVAAGSSITAAVANGEDESVIEGYQRKIAALERENKARGRIEAAAFKEEAKALDDGMWSDAANAAAAMAQSMERSFGSVGGAIGKMTVAMVDYGKTQRDIQLDLDKAKTAAGGNPGKIADAEAKAGKASAEAQIKHYGSMASAAKGFFKENSTGYKIMDGLEKEMQLLQLANQAEKLFTSLFVSSASAAGVVAGQATETGAVVASQAKQNAAKVPGVFMSFMSALGPWGMAAAAVAVAAVLGGAFSGGGGGAAPTTFEDRQKTQGTGTVLGDDTAKSASIANSLEIIEKNSGLELNYQNAMLMALRSIEFALGGAAKGIFQTAGLTGGSAFGTSNEATKSFWGSDTSTTITDSGVKFSGTLGNLRDGRGIGIQYEDVTKTSDGGWFHGDSKDEFTNTKALGAVAMKPFILIFDSMGELLVGAGVKLGADSVGLTNAINQISIDFAVSTRELKGQDLVDALSAGISVAFDQVAMAVFPQMEDFQKVGEGLGETLVRVASDYAAVGSIFDSIGKSLVGTSVVTTRSLFGVERTITTVGEMSVSARERLINLAGGIDELASKTSSFADNYLSQAERLAPVQKYVTDQLTAMGYAGVTTRDQFKALVLGMDASTKTGAENYATLLSLADAFAKTHAATEDLTKSEQEIADERKDLQSQLNELTMSSAQALALQRAGIDDSNKALFDQVQAAKAVVTAKDVLASAYDKESAALKTTVDRLKAFQTGILSFKDSLLLGSLSTLTPVQKAAEAQRQYEATLAKARTGDTAAQSALQAAASAYLTADQVIKASSDGYAADAAKVQADLAALAAVAGGQASDAERQMAALDAQVGALITINDSVKEGARSVAQAIAELARLGYTGVVHADGAAAAGFSSAPFGGAVGLQVEGDSAAAPSVNYRSMGTSNMAALVAEIRGLREDNMGLREDNKRLIDRVDAQTEALVTSTYDATDRAANKQVDGAKAAAMAPVYAKRMEGKLE